VEEILFAGRRAVGVRTNAGSHHADAVVVNADFARAMERMVPDHLRRRWTNAKLAKKKFSCSTFMMYLGVEGTFDLPHHTIHIASEYAKNLDDIENKHVPQRRPELLRRQNACVTDPTLAPKGHSALYVLSPVSHQHPNIDWTKERARFRKLALRKDRASSGYGDIEKRVRYERVITPADWDSRYEIYRGATFNLAHSLRPDAHLRPHNRFEDLDGMYLVGGGTHPGSGPAGDFRKRAHQLAVAARRPRHSNECSAHCPRAKSGSRPPRVLTSLASSPRRLPCSASRPSPRL
jgi:phytoene desaturase